MSIRLQGALKGAEKQQKDHLFALSMRGVALDLSQGATTIEVVTVLFLLRSTNNIPLGSPRFSIKNAVALRSWRRYNPALAMPQLERRATVFFSENRGEPRG